MPQGLPAGFIRQEPVLPLPPEEMAVNFDEPEPNIIDGAEYIENEDGGITIDFTPQMKAPHSTPFEANLVEELPSDEVKRITEELLEAYEDDKGSRSEWEETLKHGMKFLGLKYEERTRPFKDACGAYDSTMLASALSWQATVTSEFLPATGPVDTQIYGAETELKTDQAKRVKQFMNFYLTSVASEFYPNVDQMIMWLNIVGMIVKKTYQDPILLRPVSLYITPENFIVSETNTNDLKSCTRMTHEFTLTAKEMREMQLAGVYLDAAVTPDEDESDESPIRAEVSSIQGITRHAHDKDKLFTNLEFHVDLDIKGLNDQGGVEIPERLPVPYIVTIAKDSRKMIALRRNWDKDDPKFKKIEYFTEFRFTQGFGFYGLGLAHLMGGSSRVTTSILRQLVDAGTFQNFPAGLKAKGLKPENNDVMMGPGEFKEVDTGGMAIKDAFMPMPYNGPSAPLADLRREMVAAAEKIGALTNVKLTDLPTNVAMGTVLALLEETTKLPNSIMSRIYNAMKNEFSLIGKLFAKYLPDEPYAYKMIGEENYVTSKDFNEDVAIVPIGDATAASSAKRLLKVYAIKEIAQTAPEIYNLRAIHEEMLKMIGVDNIERILPPPPPLPNPEDAPPPPIDPSLVLMEEVKVKAQEVDAHFKEAEMRAETEAFKAQLKFESDQAKREIDEKLAILKSQTDIALTKIKALTDLQKQSEKTAAENERTQAEELDRAQQDIMEAGMID